MMHGQVGTLRAQPLSHLANVPNLADVVYV